MFSACQCFPVQLSTSGNIVAETKFASKEAKKFSDGLETFFCYDTMFSSLPKCFEIVYTGKHDRILTGNNVSATMFPTLPTQGLSPRGILVSCLYLTPKTLHQDILANT